MTVQGDENHGGRCSGKSPALFHAHLLKQVLPDVVGDMNERSDENVVGFFSVKNIVHLKLKAPETWCEFVG